MHSVAVNFLASKLQAMVMPLKKKLVGSMGWRVARCVVRPEPSWLMRALAVFDKELRRITPGLDRQTQFNANKLRNMLH